MTASMEGKTGFEPAREGGRRGRAFYRRRPERARRALALVALAAPLGSCQMITSLNAFTPAQDVELGTQTYAEILSGAKVVSSGPQVEGVRRVANKLIEAARATEPELVELFEWETNLIDDPETVNAFCLPGGKIAVYTGILPVTQDDAGLAVVLGHEIAHATRRHGTKAVTRQLGLDIVVRAALGEDYLAIAQVGESLVHLSFGREAELEADSDGLRFLARAGYDPREAVRFWQRMEALGGEAPPEWLSTHPSHGHRIEQLEEMMPEALELWRGATRAAP